MLQSAALDKDRRASMISNYSKTITQYKVDLMSLNLNTLENIQRGHRQTLVDLDKTISQDCSDQLKQVIHNRRQTMKKRHEKFLEHTLKTFFDEAPTTVLLNE